MLLSACSDQSSTVAVTDKSPTAEKTKPADTDDVIARAAKFN